MYHGEAEAGVGVMAYQDLTRQEVEEERTWMYSQRVLVGHNPHPCAPIVEFDIDQPNKVLS